MAVRTFLAVIAAISLRLASNQALAAVPAASLSLPPRLLTNAAQILDLSASQASLDIPVQLHGVVVDESAPREHAVILADESGGIYVFAATNLFAPFHRKDVLDIKGVTSAGQFAPCVRATEVRKVGWTNPPPPRPATYQQLITGALDAQYIKIRGVVRECWPARPGDDTWRIVLFADGGIIPVRVPLPQDPQVQVDAEVTIEAVCLYEFNQRRQAISPVLQVTHGVSIQVNKPAPSNPYAAPIRSSASLLQYSHEIPYGHRVHVRGVVTCSEPGSLVWIRDESSGLRIQTRQTDELHPGDEIDVLGFPGYGSSIPILEDAVYRKIGMLPSPPPFALTNPLEAYDHQDDLVSIKARLTEIQPVLNGLVLNLMQSNTVFKAVLNLSLNSRQLPSWQPGSWVRVVGICDVIYNSSTPVMGIWHPQSFQILLRSPADLVVLEAPSWWTATHLMFLLSIFAGGSLGVAGGVALLARRRLNEQARRRTMAEAEFAAILAERNRLAREIHDTLAQGLAATSVQLQLAKVHMNGVAGPARQHLEVAEELVRNSLEEARNSIWNMRPQVLETSSLSGALKSILEKLSEGVLRETHLDVTGRERRLAAVIETNILRIGQEAIANAVNHAAAHTLHVKLHFGEKDFSLIVSDDGKGFDPNNPPPSKGGFGLVGMRERARALNGKLTIHAAPNQGTQVNLWVPLAG
jgi:signal transduction histidine kinase